MATRWALSFPLIKNRKKFIVVSLNIMIILLKRNIFLVMSICMKLYVNFYMYISTEYAYNNICTCVSIPKGSKSSTGEWSQMWEDADQAEILQGEKWEAAAFLGWGTAPCRPAFSWSKARGRGTAPYAAQQTARPWDPQRENDPWKHHSQRSFLCCCCSVCSGGRLKAIFILLSYCLVSVHWWKTSQQLWPQTNCFWAELIWSEDWLWDIQNNLGRAEPASQGFLCMHWQPHINKLCWRS